MEMDINTDNSRGRLASFSKYSSKESSVHLNVSSIPYYKRMEIQSNNLLWSEQM